ncbi:MAG: lysylphosphatidylglycerol synthase transmembrane domain-containing protein, partial [bacterium]
SLIASHTVRAWRWGYLLEPIKRGIGMRNLFSGVMVGYMVNNVLPRAGEIVRPFAIGKLEGIPRSAAFGTIVVERIIDTILFLILIAIMPLVYNGPLRETFPWLDDARFLLSILTMAFVAFLVALVLRRDWADVVIVRLVKIFPKRLATAVNRLTHEFLDGFLFLKKPKQLPLIIVQSFAIWILYIFAAYTAFFAFDLNLDFNAAIVVQAISSIGVAIPTPGGTGSYHMFASQTLTKLFGVPGNVALSYATVTHGVGFIGTMIIGLYFFFKDHIKVSEAIAKGGEQAP